MQRLFIGDVQGCADELDEMLARARRRFGARFELWSVGDLVNRGPCNLRVLRRVRELVEAGRGRVVLGNHELALLRTALGLRPLGPRDSFGDVLEAPDADDWLDWIARQPLLAVGRIADQRFAMVHAAVPPGASLDVLEADAARASRALAADPAGFLGRAAGGGHALLEQLTRCRSVAPDGRWSSEPPAGPFVPWHVAWRRRGHDFGVIYGHWSLQGLHVAPGLRGLDTGCVHHGRGHEGALTAWVPDPERSQPFAVPDDRFWRVPARRAYYRDVLERERAP